MQHLSYPTATFPNTCILLLSWSSAQSFPKSAIFSEANHRLHPTVTLMSVCIGRDLEPQAFDLLMLRPSECSWVIVFHKGQNADLTVRAKCKLEKLHLAFLWLTQASRWKWFPKVTAKLSATVSLMWQTYGVTVQVRTSFPILTLDFGRVSLPLRTSLQSWETHRNSVCLSSPLCPSHYTRPKPCSCVPGIMKGTKEEMCLLPPNHFHFLK